VGVRYRRSGANIAPNRESEVWDCPSFG
jgi:hypothetical protein